MNIFAKGLCAWGWRNAVFVQELSTRVKPSMSQWDNRNMFPEGSAHRICQRGKLQLEFQAELGSV